MTSLVSTFVPADSKSTLALTHVYSWVCGFSSFTLFSITRQRTSDATAVLENMFAL